MWNPNIFGVLIRIMLFSVILETASGSLSSVDIKQEGPRSMVNSTECDLLVIKADPEDVDFYKQEAGYGPAYHMNKKHWLSILLSGPADDEDVMAFVDQSYVLTL